jgi:hypothetical protein
MFDTEQPFPEKLKKYGILKPPDYNKKDKIAEKIAKIKMFKPVPEEVFIEIIKDISNVLERVVIEKVRQVPVKNKIDELVKKYSIIHENTISVIYRSTDKWTDMGGFNHISPALYMRLTKKLKEETPQYDVFIQSESSGINRVFNESFGSKSIQETLVSTIDGLPLFLHLDKNKLEWSEYYVASLIIHSKSKILITYTGNSSFFVYLSRGTTKNMYQEITFTKNNYEDFFTKNN